MTAIDTHKIEVSNKGKKSFATQYHTRMSPIVNDRWARSTNGRTQLIPPYYLSYDVRSITTDKQQSNSGLSNAIDASNDSHGIYDNSRATFGRHYDRPTNGTLSHLVSKGDINHNVPVTQRPSSIANVVSNKNSPAKVTTRRCTFDEDCDYIDTACDQRSGSCMCPDGYYRLRALQTKTASVSIQPMLTPPQYLIPVNDHDLSCVRPALLGHVCTADVQCLPGGSYCPSRHFSLRANTCRCRPGFMEVGEKSD